MDIASIVKEIENRRKQLDTAFDALEADGYGDCVDALYEITMTMALYAGIKKIAVAFQLTEREALSLYNNVTASEPEPDDDEPDDVDEPEDVPVRKAISPAPGPAQPGKDPMADLDGENL